MSASSEHEPKLEKADDPLKLPQPRSSASITMHEDEPSPDFSPLLVKPTSLHDAEQCFESSGRRSSVREIAEKMSYRDSSLAAEEEPTSSVAEIEPLMSPVSEDRETSADDARQSLDEMVDEVTLQENLQGELQNEYDSTTESKNTSFASDGARGRCSQVNPQDVDSFRIKHAGISFSSMDSSQCIEPVSTIECVSESSSRDPFKRRNRKLALVAANERAKTDISDLPNEPVEETDIRRLSVAEPLNVSSFARSSQEKSRSTGFKKILRGTTNAIETAATVGTAKKSIAKKRGEEENPYE